MDNLKTFEEYKYFPVRKTIPGYDWKKGEYADVPNKKDENEPFFNKNKPAYFDKKNKNSEVRSKESKIEYAQYLDKVKKMELKFMEFFENGVFSDENIIEVKEDKGFYPIENDYYKFITKDGRKFKYHMSYSSYESEAERADFEGAYLSEYENGKVNKLTINDENLANKLVAILEPKMGNYKDKWDFVDDDENSDYVEEY